MLHMFLLITFSFWVQSINLYFFFLYKLSEVSISKFLTGWMEILMVLPVSSLLLSSPKFCKLYFYILCWVEFFLCSLIIIRSLVFCQRFILKTENIWTVWSFGNYEKSCYKHPYTGFWVGVGFWVLWVNIKKHDHWITW